MGAAEASRALVIVLQPCFRPHRQQSSAKQAKLKKMNYYNRKEALTATESMANLMTNNVQVSVNEVCAARIKLEKEVRSLTLISSVFCGGNIQSLLSII